MLTAESTLNVFATRTRQLYSLPAVALEVLELTDQPRVDCRQLQHCIERDPALVSKVLRVVNSSLFGLGTPVANLNQAIALLGIKPLKLLVLGFSLSDSMFREVTGPAMENAWRHTLTRAVAARELCEIVWRVSGDEAFIAGLLADLGKFVLLDELGESYAKVLEAATRDGENLSALEQTSLGFDHTQLTVELLTHWNLPERLVAAVSIANRPDQLTMLGSPECILPRVVRVAGLLADMVVDHRHDLLPELLEEPVGPADLKQVIDRVQSSISSWADALSFRLPPGTDYRDVLIAAHERLARLSTDAAGLMARQLPITEHRGVEVANLAAAVDHYVTRHEDAPARAVSKPPRVEPVRAVETPGDHGKLPERLAMVITRCRQLHRPVSLLLVAIDRAGELADTYGEAAMQRLTEKLHTLASAVDHPGNICLRQDATHYAQILAGCDRRAAVKLGQQLLAGLRSFATREFTGKPPTISIGLAEVASPSKNFPATDLLIAAERCLSAAQLSGGNTLKSIDVY